MPDRVTITRYDQSKERTATSFHLEDISAGNFDEVVAAATGLQSALDGITLSDWSRQSISITSKVVSPTYVGNRETKWLLRLRDDIGDNYAVEVGTADESMGVINVGGKTVMDPASAAYVALAAAIAADAVVSKTGNGLTLVEAELVGRNI